MRRLIGTCAAVSITIFAGVIACKDTPAGPGDPGNLNIELLTNTSFENSGFLNASGWHVVGMPALAGNRAVPATGGAWSLELDAQPSATVYAENLIPPGTWSGTGTYKLLASTINLGVGGSIGIGTRSGGVSTIAVTASSDSNAWHKVVVTGEVTLATGDSLVARLTVGNGAAGNMTLYDLVSFMRTK